MEYSNGEGSTKWLAELTELGKSAAFEVFKGIKNMLGWDIDAFRRSWLQEHGKHLEFDEKWNGWIPPQLISPISQLSTIIAMECASDWVSRVWLTKNRIWSYEG